MSEATTTKYVTASIFPAGIGLGVWWFMWGVNGFWWGVLYGSCWPIWAGYHLAAALTP